MSQDEAHLSDADLAALRRLNVLRAAAAVGDERDELESLFAGRFKADWRLAVYGSLAPGRANHHVISGVPGEWVSGLVVRGELLTTGWAASLGHRALKWRADGPEVEVALFISQHLPLHWPRLDEFEGEEYGRILVPLYREGGFETVANIYEARAS